jgi:beta-lactamase regulating signal transducer with metallopeptidase domain
MSWAGIVPGDWFARTALSGCLLLLVVWGFSLFARQPARRQRLAEGGVLAALLLPCLTLAPSWLWLPSPFPGQTVPVTASPPSEKQETGAWDFGPAYFSEELTVATDGSETLPPVEDRWPVPQSAQQETSRFLPNDTSLTMLVPWLIALYVIVASAFLGRWFLGHLLLWRFLRQAVAVPEPVARLFAEMTPRRHRPRLLAVTRLRAPVSCGLFRPTIVLPADLCEPVQRPVLRWVFAHELTHLERRDAWSCLLFGLSGAVYFYCPWFWWLRRQVRLCREYVADAAAVRLAQAEDYAQFLLNLATAPAGPMTAIGVRGKSSDLFRRVTMLLKNPLRVEMQCPRRWALASAFGFLAMAVLASGVGLHAADADPTAGAALADDKQPDRKEVPRPTPAEYGRALEEFKKALEKLDLDKLKTNQDLDKLRQRLMKEAEEFDKTLKSLHQEHRNALDGSAENPAFRGRFRSMQPPQAGFFFGRQDGRLGVMVESPNPALADQLDLPKGRGLVVVQVQPESAGAKAGLKVNDILLEIDGKQVSTDSNELRKMVHELKSNTPVDALVLRKGKKETVKGISLPDAPAEPRPGLPAGRFPGRGGVAGGGGTRDSSVPGQPGDRVPVPNRPGAGGFPGVGPAGGAGAGGFAPPGAVPGFPANAFWGGGPNTVMTSVFRNNNSFTGRHQEGSLVISVTGTVADGKAKLSEIHVQDGNETHKGESVERIPERYRDKVKNLIDMCEKGSVKVEIKRSSGQRVPDEKLFDRNIK